MRRLQQEVRLDVPSLRVTSRATGRNWSCVAQAANALPRHLRWRPPAPPRYVLQVYEVPRQSIRASLRWFTRVLLPCMLGSCAEARGPRDSGVPVDAATDASEAEHDAPDLPHDARQSDASGADAACDSESARLGVSYFERFGDHVDSNCDGDDDPAVNHEPCSCAWLAPSGMPEVTLCGVGYNPEDAQAALRSAQLGPAACAGLPDLKLAFVVQCTSQCSGVPIFVSVANVGGTRSGPARLRLIGQFRNDEPRGALAIEPLEPGQFTPLMDILATGTYRITVETDAAQCDEANDAVEVNAYDAHCGFFGSVRDSTTGPVHGGR